MKTQKINPAIGRLLVGVGWPPRTQPNLWQKITHTAPGSVTPRDLDLFCEILHSSGSVQEIIDAGNSRSDNGAVVHLQDNLSGQGEGDDEQMVLDLDLLPNSINKLRFCVRLASGSEEKKIRRVIAAPAQMINEVKLRWRIEKNQDTSSCWLQVTSYRLQEL